MTLSFSTQIGGNPTHFVEKIWAAFNLGEGEYQNAIDRNLLAEVGIKIHAIRADKKNRWRVGMPIHFVIHNRTPKRFQFAPTLPVKALQEIKIRWSENHERMNIWIDGVSLDRHQILTLAKNDGFENVWSFAEYFNSDFDGKIIHWTDFIYSF